MKCKICSNIIKGRSDKKFCSVRCKNYYHTNLQRVTDTAVHDINKILHRNRSILIELLGKQITQLKLQRIKLDKKKFNFKYHTHYNVNSEGKTYFFVYDIGWMQFSDNEVLIIKKR
jgi:predicted nucleic acid-binding Zn ribbon protein/YHS domain-containing protein